MTMRSLPCFCIAAFFVLAGSAAAADETTAPPVKEGSTYSALDTLDCSSETTADGIACLNGLKWERAPFTVTCQPGKADGGDWLMRFPSPFPSGDAVNDLVAMEWHVARDENDQPMRAPAVVVVHESGRGMVAGRIFARGLKMNGLHTFLIHLPGYGARTSERTRDMTRMLPALRQAVADVRRARDAVASLPLVDTSLIAVQGTSLGGFVTATVAGLDRGYDRIFILLAGGNIADVVLNGTRDAATIRRQLAAAGVTEQQIRELSRAIEPMRLAHRVDPAKTWLFSGKYDEVVPPRCSHAFAEAAKLDDLHHQEMPVGHYSAAFLLPVTLKQISNLIHGITEPAVPQSEPVPAATPAPESAR